MDLQDFRLEFPARFAFFPPTCLKVSEWVCNPDSAGSAATLGPQGGGGAIEPENLSPTIESRKSKPPLMKTLCCRFTVFSPIIRRLTGHAPWCGFLLLNHHISPRADRHIVLRIPWDVLIAAFLASVLSVWELRKPRSNLHKDLSHWRVATLQLQLCNK